MPLYLLGFMGATRRLDHYEASTGWHPLFVVAGFGALLIGIAVTIQVIQLYVSIKQRNQNRDTTGDPWDGRTLEWSTTSPPTFYNFAHTPEVHGRDAFWAMKHSKKTALENRPYEDIHMPSNSPVGFYIGVLSLIGGFALVWHMFWLGGLSILGIVVTLIVRLGNKHPHYYVKAEEVERIETRTRNA